MVRGEYLFKVCFFLMTDRDNALNNNISHCSILWYFDVKIKYSIVDSSIIDILIEAIDFNQ